MQSTRIRRSGGLVDTCEMAVRSVAVETVTPEPDKSKVTTFVGKFVAAN